MKQVLMGEVPVGDMFIYVQKTVYGGGNHYNGIGCSTFTKEILCVRTTEELYRHLEGGDNGGVDGGSYNSYYVNEYCKVFI